MVSYLVNYGQWVSLIVPKNVRVLCEGISDRDSLKEIFKKEDIRKKVIKFNSKPRLLKKVNKYIHANDEIVDIFIIVVDSHCTDPSVTYNEVHRRIEPFNIEKVRIHIIKHALETWFLAEENAIKERFGINFRTISNPETICKPDETLKELLRRAGIIKYQKSIHAKAISKMLNIENLRNKSENFSSFISLIINAQSDN